MLDKIIPIIQIWIGLSFVAIVIGYIPSVGPMIAGFITQLLGFLGAIPYYNLILGIAGTVLFINGIMHLTGRGMY